jgi:hypothetical protein
MPDLKINVDVTGAQKGAADLNQVAAATDKTTAAAGKSAGATSAAASSTAGLSDAVSQLAGRNNDAKDAIEGATSALKGNEGSLFGVAKLWKGLVGVLAGAAGPFGLVVLALTAVKAGLDFVVDRSNAARDSMRNFAGEGERTAGALKQVEDASKKALAGAKEQVDALTESYKTLNGQIDAAAARVDKLNSAQTALKLAQLDQEEATALSKSSPDQGLRDSIRRDFTRRREDVRAEGERTRLENTGVKAGVEEKAATEALRGFREQLDAAALATREAEDRVAGERSKLSSVDASSVNSDFGRSLRDAVKVAEAAAQAARDNQAAIQAALAPQIAEATQRVTNASDTRKLVGVQQQTASVEQTTRDTSRRNEDIDLQRKAEQDRQKKLADGLRGSTQEVQSSPGLDAQPIEQAAQQQAAVVTQKFTESNAASQASAQSIAAATAVVSALPIIDLAPVTVAFGQYHNAVLTKFTGVERSIQGLERSIQLMKQQIQSQQASR